VSKAEILGQSVGPWCSAYRRQACWCGGCRRDRYHWRSASCSTVQGDAACSSSVAMHDGAADRVVPCRGYDGNKRRQCVDVDTGRRNGHSPPGAGRPPGGCIRHGRNVDATTGCHPAVSSSTMPTASAAPSCKGNGSGAAAYPDSGSNSLTAKVSISPGNPATTRLSSSLSTPVRR